MPVAVFQNCYGGTISDCTFEGFDCGIEEIGCHGTNVTGNTSIGPGTLFRSTNSTGVTATNNRRLKGNNYHLTPLAHAVRRAMYGG